MPQKTPVELLFGSWQDSRLALTTRSILRWIKPFGVWDYSFKVTENTLRSQRTIASEVSDVVNNIWW